jgi:hypothetical protein
MKKVSHDEFVKVAVDHNFVPAKVAAALGADLSNTSKRIKQIKAKLDQFDVKAPDPGSVSVLELIEHRKKQFDKKRRHEETRKLIPIRIKLPGPIGLLHFGDPHVDDDGTDLALLESHMDLCRTVEGLYGCNVGDTTNNWVGRLGRLYAQQGTTADDAWQIAEWFITNVPWLYMIGGNHDAWSGSGDPINWIARNAGALYQDSEVRLALNFSNKRSIHINARHDFAGHSMYNPVHGATKALHFGIRDHIAICGHKHVSGYGILKDPDTGITMHAIQVSSYKVYDRYARERGFRDQSVSPCALTVIDPDMPATHPDLIKVFWDPFEGADFLKFKRRKARK